MKIRSMQTCICHPCHVVFLDVVFLDMSLWIIFFKLCYLIVISFTLVANKYLLTYLLEVESLIPLSKPAKSQLLSLVLF